MNGQRSPSQRGCVWAEDCIEICTGRSVYVEDQGVRATFVNSRRRQIRKVHYDACYFVGQEKRADFIVGSPGEVDIIVELKGTDTNLKIAARQVESTLDAWEQDPKCARSIAALIIFGRIEGRKRLPGRVPRTSAVVQGLRAAFLRTRKRLLLIHENGERKFSFDEFIR